MNHVRDIFCSIINDEVETCGFRHNRNVYYKITLETLNIFKEQCKYGLI